ncbi:MAG TPA: hypothetical protein VEC38_00305 [Candidatus Binataceae bacterium]|nr:hypothetical protein [Candidatus Binataceae bacterium]
MNRLYGWAIVIGLAIAAGVSATAYASGPGHHGGHGSLLPPIIRHMVSKSQIKSVMASEKTNLHNAFGAVRSAKNQLEDDLIAGKDTAGDMSALQAAENSLLAEKVTIAQKILANLTPAQRTQVGSFVSQYRSLNDQQRQQRMQLFQQFGGAGTSQQAE